VSEPQSNFVESSPRLHYLEWNPYGRETLVLLHGSSANAWWWQPLARAIDGDRFRLLALDQRGHGDSEWVRPAAYTPDDYAGDLARFIRSPTIRSSIRVEEDRHSKEGDLPRPIVIGHSMGGLSVLSFAAQFGVQARAAIAIDVAVTSTRRRDRFLSRLKSLPTVTYPDLETALARFRLIPAEGEISQPILAEVAEHSFQRTPDGSYTLKFDRESFFGGDGLDVPAAIARASIPTLLIRAEMSRIMTAEASAIAAESNPLVRLVEIPGAHHHVPLQCPDALARAITEFVDTLP
jgi:pimeloyl-ACP methyl ester carboxylesterase